MKANAGIAARKAKFGLGRLRRDDHGATVVEFALVAPLFLMLLIGIIEIGVLGMMSATFNDAVLTVTRRIRTGQADGPRDATDFRSQICAAIADSQASCRQKLSISVRAIDSKGGFAGANAALKSAGDDTAGEPFDKGVAGQIILVTATYRWPLVIPFAEDAFASAGGSDVLIVARMVFKNEPYS
ncbi:MAG: hypothetical protein JWQ46_1348 [Phenylobacterium sp.]|nr:hypothetical protein [Phenylobacterium sp.]